MISCPNHAHDTAITINEDVLHRRVAVRTCRACGETLGVFPLRTRTSVDLIDLYNQVYADKHGWKSGDKFKIR